MSQGGGSWYATIFVGTALLSLVLTPLALRLALHRQVLDHPGGHKGHESPVPYLGGLAMVAAFTLAVLVAALMRPPVTGRSELFVVLGLAFGLSLVGLLDDVRHLRPWVRLLCEIGAGYALYEVGAGVQLFPSDVANALFTIVWVVAIANAFNLLDNMDGLAAGVALIAAAFLAVLLGPWFGFGLSTLLVALVGALAGFLYWNRPRARLFMGDCGSLFIGAILGGVSLVPVFHARIAFISPTVLAALILVVPLFDTAFVLVLRRLAGRSATRGGTDHVSHRLVSLGFSERSAVRILYLLGLIGGLTAWVLVTWNTVEPMLVVALFGVLVILTGIYLARVPAYNAEDFKALQKSSFAPFLKDLAFKWHVGEVLLDLVLITICYYAAFRLRFEGNEFDNFRPYFTSSLPLILGIKIAALYGSGLYRRSWETFGFRDLASVARGVGMGSLLTVAVAYYLYRGEGSSRVVLVVDGLLLALAIFATRASFRTMNLVASARNRRHRRVLVYGAGGYGRLLVREMKANPAWKMNPVGFIDDDPMKAHRWIVGVPVRGSIEQLEQTMRRYSVDEVVLSSPAINGKVEHRIKEVCARLQRPVRRLDMKIT